LIVAGYGRLPDELVKTSSADTEVINRYVSDEQVARLINRCSIVALPYTSATQSGVVALAQAFHRPVVATAVGGLREMVIPGRTGILVRPGDAGAFGKALSSLARNGALRAKMQREIRKVADSKWGPQVVARMYLEVYASSLHRREKP